MSKDSLLLAGLSALLTGGGFILWWMSRPFRARRAKIEAAQARAEYLARRLFEMHKGSPIPAEALEAAAQEVIALCETAPADAVMSMIRRRYLRELAGELDEADEAEIIRRYPGLPPEEYRDLWRDDFVWWM